jgi:hypothetical protein
MRMGSGGGGDRGERLYLGPKVPRKPRRRRFHVAAIIAAALYASGGYVAYELGRTALYGEERVAGGAGEGAGADVPPGETEPAAAAITSQDRAALLALASRAQQSVYVIESSGSAHGSGFVGWTFQGDALVMTAYRTVEGVIAQGEDTVFVRRGSRIWTGEIIRSHRPNGLALIRVGAELDRPLWQRRAAADKLEPNGIALVVPAGPEAAVGEGTASAQERGRIRVQAPAHQLNLGAPVLGADGRIAGVVTATEPGGVNLVVPIEAACAAEIRLCG